jgi:hypothetical protein
VYKMRLAISPIVESTETLLLPFVNVPSKQSRLYYCLCTSLAPVHCGDLSVMALRALVHTNLAPVVEFFTRTGITTAGGQLILTAAQERCLFVHRSRKRNFRALIS